MKSTVIHSHSSLQSQIRFQTKMGKAYSVYPFSDQNSKNHTHWDGTYIYGLFKGVPTPSSPFPGQIMYLLEYVYTCIP